MPHWSRLVSPLSLTYQYHSVKLIYQKGLCQPHIVDPALSQIGEEQMSHLSLKLKSINDLQLPSKVYTSITKRTCQSSVAVWRPILPKVPITALQVNHPFNPAFHESLNSELIDRI